ncbi:MAG: glycosyltransferase family 87 protein [Nocardioidaceae bacterium]
MTFVGARRTHDDVVAPTLDDPVAMAASAPIGGPLGRHSRGSTGWWTPMRAVLAVAMITFGLGVIQKSPCVVERWADAQTPFPYSHLCYSDLGALYVNRGLAEGMAPYEPVDDLPSVKQPATADAANDLTLEYPVGAGLWLGLAALVTHAVGESPDLSDVPHEQVGADLRVQHDTAVFWGVNAVGLFLLMLGAVALLVRAQRRRPWDAMLVAASPALALTALINVDLLALVSLAGILWAWSTRRPSVTGVLIGLGAATKLFPVFVLGPLFVLCLRERRLPVFARTFGWAVVSWLVIDVPVYIWSPDAFSWFWTFNARRGPDFGSLWLVASNYGHTASAHTINLVMWLLFVPVCAAVAALGLLAPRRPRLVQLLYLVVVAFLIINKVYSPQYVLWLLPLAALARPRWRDMAIWQACEIFYFFAVWMHIADFFVAAGSPDWLYAVAVGVRIAGELYVAALVVRDIWLPWHDPVRSDGLSDDPLGGILDEGIDAERWGWTREQPDDEELAGLTPAAR